MSQIQSSDRLALLYYLSQTFNSSLDLDEVLNSVIDEVINLTRAERGYIMLQTSGGQLQFRVARGIDQTTINEPQFQVSHGVVERVAREGKPVLTSNAQIDERFNLRRSILDMGLRSILCVPICLKERVIGVIYVDSRIQTGLFTQADLELLNAIASSAAIAIENARLHQVAVEKGQLEQELQMARRVQIGLLPRRLPHLAGWEFIAHWQPARQVGGDYYDFIPLKNNKLGIVIADVTDKGMPAALFMAFTRSLVRAYLDQARSPSKGITRINRLMHQESENGLHVTLFYLLISLPTGEITYVNAGHNPPLLFHIPDPMQPYMIAKLPATGIPLGINEKTQYTQNQERINPGDFIVLYTDGVTEAMNDAGELFGMERLQQVLVQHQKQPPVQIAAALEEKIRDFSGPSPPHDDVTFLIIRRM